MQGQMGTPVRRAVPTPPRGPNRHTTRIVAGPVEPAREKAARHALLGCRGMQCLSSDVHRRALEQENTPQTPGPRFLAAMLADGA